jgi:hypothetical protein
MRRRVRDEIEEHGGFPMPDAPLPDAAILIAIAVLAALMIYWLA